MNIIFFMTLFFMKWSRLVVFCQVFKCFGGHFAFDGPVFEWLRLDRFGINKIFLLLLLIKRSRLVDHSKTDEIGPVFEWLRSMLTTELNTSNKTSQDLAGVKIGKQEEGSCRRARIAIRQPRVTG
jgi:hypothetical protein